MKSRTGQFLMAAVLLLSAGVAGAADKKAPAPTTDEAIANAIRHEVIMYADYSIWDDVDITVVNGNVHLTGAVSQPIKKDEINRLASRVAGVAQLQNDVRVLPLSPNDDRLRLIVARAIYSDPTMRRYAEQPLKPIHIVVENGHVMLAGMVDTEADKEIAGIRASGAGLSFGPIVNNLQVANPARKS